MLRLKDVCQLTDGEKRNGKGICLDAKYLRSKSSASIVEKGKFVYAGDNIILVDGENSGEVFPVPQNGYMGSTFKQLWLSSVMWKPYILAFILFYKDELRNSKRGAAIPHLNKELFYNLPIGIPPLAEQQRIACQINNLFQLINNNSIIATIRLCSFRGGSGNKRLFKLLEFNVLPFMASLESPRLDIIGKM